LDAFANLPNPTVITGTPKIAEMIHISELANPIEEVH
jgi:hypothetical protein